MRQVAASIHPRAQRGLSLIEILVGVAIGIIGLLAIFQTVAVWNKHTQTTSAGSDAQVAGTLALFNIERDLKLAGFGFGGADATVAGCTVQADDAGRSFTFPFTPIEIIRVGAGGAPDVIRVLHGNSSFFVTPERFTASTSDSKYLARRNGFKPGDLAVVAGNATPGTPATCQMVEVTDDSNPDGFTLGHTTAAYASYYAASGAASAPPRFNTVAGTGTTFSNGTLYNLGPRPQQNTWQIVNGRTLERADLIAGPPAFQIADGVINLKAEYGYDADGNGRIDDATEWLAAPPAPVDWTRVLAVRVAVLVRSRQFEVNGDTTASAPAAVTTTAPTWAGGTFLMTNLDGTTTNVAGDPNNWRQYRYRVYERVIPLRNMIWGTLP